MQRFVGERAIDVQWKSMHANGFDDGHQIHWTSIVVHLQIVAQLILLVSYQQPHQPVTTETIARWLKTK